MNQTLIIIWGWLKSRGLASQMSICLVFGAISGLALPPVHGWWLLGFTVPALLALIENCSKKRAFLLGWVFGFGYFLAVLHWIAFAFFVDAQNDLWMMPFAVGGLSAILALYWGLGALGARWLYGRGVPVYLAGPLVLTITEYLRGILFTGFPWGAPGQVVDGMGGVAQASYLIGMNGLTLLVLLWATAPLALLRKSWRVGLCSLMLLPALWVWGEVRLAQNATQFVDGVNLRIVQPNIAQSDKWRAGNARKIFDQLLALSAQQSSNGKPITHVIWPESAVPFLLDESAEGLAEIAGILDPSETLITGAVRRSTPSDAADYFTSVMMIDGEGKVIGHYDKAHLVPGGEYLPLERFLAPLGFRRVVNLPESFTAGHGAESLPVPGAGLVGAQICYEAIFPAEVVDSRNRPNWLINVTNDGWFGNSAGPRQHLAQLRLRAIEQGLSVARSANTGISAIIDPFGRYLLQSDMNVAGAFDQPLPQSIAAGPYARFGDWIVLALVLGLAGLAWRCRKTCYIFR